jgi:outer membrane protein TolC
LLVTACSNPQVVAGDEAGVAFQRHLDTRESVPEPGLAPLAVDSPTLNLQQAIDLVLERNPGTDIAAAHIARAGAAMAESRAAFMPQVNVDLGYLRADAPSAYLFKTIDARGFVPGTDFNDPGAFSNWEAGIGVGYNLYSGGSHELAGDLAALQRRAAELGLAALHNRLTAMTIDLWFGALVAYEQQQVAELSVATVAAQLEEARVLHEEGSVLRSDVLSLQVRLAEAQEMVILSGNGMRLARTGLAGLLAMAESEMPKLEIDLAELPAVEIPSDLSSALARAFEQRPELEQLRLGIEQSELQVARVAAGARPTIDLFGRAWADNPDVDFDGSEANWSVGIAASWNLFDGGARDARTARAKASLLEAHARNRAALSDVRQDVEAAYLRLGAADARLDVTRGAVEAALESLRLVRVQYEGGAATVTRYLEAEQMATAARQRLNQATFDRRRAAADLARAVGAFASRGDRK